jgi:N-carbamoylputrescine amidase
MTRKVKVGCIQSGGERFDREKTIDKVVGLIRKAADQGAEYVVTCELFNRWMFPMCENMNPDFYDFAEPIPGPTTDALGKLAKEKKMYIMAGIYESTNVPLLYFDSMALIGPEGKVMGRYRKMHAPMILPKIGTVDPYYQDFEKFYYAPGDLGFPVYTTETREGDKMTLGMAICYDRNFPETWRIYTLKGAEVVFKGTSSSGFRGEYYQFELRTHAYENGIYIVGANRWGNEGSPNKELGFGEKWMHFYGTSCIVDPFGMIAASAGDDGEKVVVAEIDLDKVADARKRLTYLRDRRPEFYKELVQLLPT